MKNMLFAFLVVFMSAIAGAALAQTKEETRLDKDAVAIDKDATTPEGGKAVVQRLENMFKVDDTRINSLRSQGLGYGEIAIVLAMAQKLGGITDANIKEIMSMRQGTPKQGWGEIAKALKLGKIGSIISPVEKLEKAAHNDIEKTERGQKGIERPERMEKPERPERPEKMGR